MQKIFLCFFISTFTFFSQAAQSEGCKITIKIEAQKGFESEAFAKFGGNSTEFSSPSGDLEQCASKAAHKCTEPYGNTLIKANPKIIKSVQVFASFGGKTLKEGRSFCPSKFGQQENLPAKTNPAPLVSPTPAAK